MSSELENVKSQVQLTVSTIDDAAKATQTAYANADDKKERLNALGVHASYQGLVQACEKLQQAMGTLSTAHGEATKAGAALGGVESTMPIPESIPKLGSAVSELGTATTSLAAASELVTNAKTDAEQVGVEGIVAVCQGALDMIDAARGTITTTSNAVSEYQKRLEQETRELTDLNTGTTASPDSSSNSTLAVSPHAMERSGQAPAPHPVYRRRAYFGDATSSNYKSTFFDKHPHTEGNVVVHHAVEQQVKNRYPGLIEDAQLHSYENLRGIPKGEINNTVHLSQIRKSWNRFYKKNPRPTRQQLLDHATEIDNMYGARFDPPVR